MTCANAVSARPLTPSDRAGFRSDFAPQDAVRTPAAPPRRPRAEHGCRSGWAVGEQDGVRPSGQPWTIGATVAQVRDGELRGSRRYRPREPRAPRGAHGRVVVVGEVAARAVGVPVVSLVCSCPGGNTPETKLGNSAGPWVASLPRRGRLTEMPTSVPLHWLDLPPAHRRAAPRPSRPAGRRRRRRGTRLRSRDQCSSIVVSHAPGWWGRGAAMHGSDSRGATPRRDSVTDDLADGPHLLLH